MPQLTFVFEHAILWGAALSLYLGVAFLALLRLNAEMWLDDYPPDIREAFGEMGPAARRQRILLGTPVLAIALAIVAYATMHLIRTAPSAPGFAEVFAHTFVMLMLFNVVDLVVIDWLLLLRLRPSWAILPGTEDLAGYHDYAFHCRAFLKGTVGILVISAAIGGVAVLLTRR